jgi:hypothetical protein
MVSHNLQVHGLAVIVPLRTAALSHRKPASENISCDRYNTQAQKSTVEKIDIFVLCNKYT